MTAFFFWIFSALMIGFAALVVLNRNPVASALSLVVSFVGLAALFILLDAFFLGIIQILVYAGAVMVLFLFIIMLLDLKAEARRRLNLVALAGGGLATLVFMGQLFAVLDRFPAAALPMPPLGGRLDDARQIGAAMFSGYNLPLQVVGVLLLVATVGTVVLSKRDLK